MASETVIDTLVTELGFRTNTAGLRGLDRRIDRIRRKLDATSRGFTVLGAGLTAALFGVGRGILGFDREMNRLQRDTNATAEEFAAMRARVIELGSSADYTTITLTDAAVALRELAKGGLSVEEAMAALPDVLNLVAATEIAVGEAATKTAKLMKGFGLEVADIPRIHDIIAHAQVTTGVTAEQMIDTLLRVAPTARAAGISIEEMAAGLATLVDQGQISERAATSLERTLVQLSKAEILPPQALEAFGELGVDITKVQDLMAQGKLIETFKLLAAAGLDVSTASRIFGEDGQRAALTLAQSIPDLEKFRASLDDIDGTMRRQADTMNRGMPGAIAAFTSSLSAATVAIGDAGLAGWIEALADRLRELVEVFTKAPESLKTLVAAALIGGPVLLLIGAGLKAMSFALGLLVPILTVARAAFALLWIAAGGPVAWVLAAIAGAAFLIYKYWDDIVADLITTKDQLVEIAKALWDAILVVFTAPGRIFDWIGEQFEQAMDSLNELAPDWLRFGGEARARSQAIGSASEGDTLGALAGTGDDFSVATAEALWSEILAVFQAPVRIFDWIGEQFDETIILQSLTASEIWDRILAVFQAPVRVFDWIGEQFSEAMDSLSAYVPDWLREPFGIGESDAGAGTGPAAALGGDEPGFFDRVGSFLTADYGPIAPGLAAASAGGGGSVTTLNRSTSINVEKVEVNADGGDPTVIATGIAAKLSEQLHNTAEDFDSSVAR